ncbi:MAG: hypothetical protein GWM93_05190 [Gemmatimonadetes bacterium]|nr:hypothetical protein [Gemmatimonadota bacterium]NIY34652.1 hypothetical protein [Gemmatimonadota bacterium]
MSTGVETWNISLLDIGPMYPFAGTEVLWALIGLGTWVLWHIIQGRMENDVYDEDEKTFTDKEKLKQAINISNAETLTEAMKTHGSGFRS